MGLKTTNYEAKKFGIVLPTAYARLASVNININGDAFGIFEIHQSREDITNKTAFDKKHISCMIDKDLPVYEQIYNAAKEQIFDGWEDDIV